jgi:hypothetical protein
MLADSTQVRCSAEQLLVAAGDLPPRTFAVEGITAETLRHRPYDLGDRILV